MLATLPRGVECGAQPATRHGETVKLREQALAPATQGDGDTGYLIERAMRRARNSSSWQGAWTEFAPIKRRGTVGASASAAGTAYAGHSPRSRRRSGAGA
jgi:hypothetical protein